MKSLAIRLLALVGLQPIPRVRRITLHIDQPWEPTEAQLKTISDLFREA